MKQTTHFNFSTATSKGQRQINEDAHWVGLNHAKQCLAIVCDGIGSQDDSQIASLMAVDVFKTAFLKHRKVRNIDVFFRKCLHNAHAQITERSKTKLNGKKIGTTLLVAFVNKTQLTVFNLGDTRLFHYSLTESLWTQITRDHNLYNYLLDMKEKDPNFKINDMCIQYRDQLFSLVRCLESGSMTHLNFDKFNLQLNLGDVILLATDGVYHFIDLKVISEILSNNTKNFEGVAKLIVQRALDNKSNDNLTSVIVECVNDTNN